VASITVLAGTNGAGKSSVAGEFLRQHGGTCFDPDQAAREILDAHPGMDQEAANGLAWNEGLRQLQTAVRLRMDYAFETTLGGATIAAALERALDEGMDVSILFVGLATVDLHLARVRERVAKGGHPIPEDAVRRRFESSRLNLIRLLARLTELKVFDNSAQADPHQGRAPSPRLLLHLRKGMLLGPDRSVLPQTPEWAKPIVEAALALEDARPPD
jgi:predicted ABC-type ATPase